MRTHRCLLGFGWEPSKYLGAWESSGAASAGRCEWESPPSSVQPPGSTSLCQQMPCAGQQAGSLRLKDTGAGGKDKCQKPQGWRHELGYWEWSPGARRIWIESTMMSYSVQGKPSLWTLTLCGPACNTSTTILFWASQDS